MHIRKTWRTRNGSTPNHWEQVLPSEGEMQAAIERVLSSNVYFTVQKYTAGTSVLDAGCGPMLWRDIVASDRYVGLDYSLALINRGNSYYSTRSLAAVGDVRFLPFANAKFDVYLSLGILEHFQEGMSLPLRECVRVLKSHGVVLISVPHFNTIRVIAMPFEILREMLLRIGNALIMLGKEKSMKKEYFYQYGYSISEIRRIFKSEGFKIIEIIGYDHEYTLTRDSFFFRRLKKKYPKILSSLNKLLVFIYPLLSSHMILIVASKAL